MYEGIRYHHYIIDFIMDPQIVSREYWLAIKAAKENFFAPGSTVPPDPIVRPEVAKSWIRAKKRGITPHSDHLPLALNADLLEKKRNQNKKLCEISATLISSFETLAQSTGYSMELFDAQGGHLLGSHLDFKEFPPDEIDWREDKAGTMAHFLALEYKKPFCVIGPEVVLDMFYDSISFCSPILGEDDNPIGALLLVQHLGDQPWEQVNPSFHRHTLGWICSLASAIEGQLSLLNKNEDLRNSSEMLRVMLESIGEAVITILPSGQITNANTEGRKMLKLNEDTMLPHIQDYLPEDSNLHKAISTGEKQNYLEQHLHINQKVIPYLINLQPVIDVNHSIASFVLRFTPQKSIDELIIRQSNAQAFYTFDDIIGQDERIKIAKEQAKHFAMTEENILLIGESGTGKELYAQAIHNHSNPRGPFIAVNCSAIPRELIESELFGYEGGAFTGAEKHGRMGKIELAHGGTLFLDEIGSMPYDMQTVLLRVLQDKIIMRVGGKQYRKVDFRLIAATNMDFAEQIREKTFREDLFFRLSVLYIDIPPLRERGRDILLLANYFIRQYAQKAKWFVTPVLSKDVEIELLSYSWPGNVRQLQNAMIYAMNMTTGNVIELQHLPKKTLGRSSYDTIRNFPEDKPDSTITSAFIDTAVPQVSRGSAGMNLEEQEKQMIISALEKTDKQIKEAAELLGLSYSSLYRRLKKYNIQV
ncbi:sigma 54-interacting transcriptional regulator [Dehalobacter sp. DCM]|uniref:sigma-54 interaction domain-containing protein n=1 Tax=Dehalobacter sp. DCM TaxID=2907827 RepID=UPI0030814B5B|nr:sigma 54-interacting transcriptional regulator [Dehalobacter sp. DCM]